jgi:hypothetical protein
MRFLPLTGNLHGAFKHVLIRIGDGDDFHGRNLNQSPQIAGPVPTGANQSHSPRFAAGNL